NLGELTLANNPVLAEAIQLPAGQRKRQVVILIGPSFRTGDESQAFQFSVDQVIGQSELNNLRPLVRRATARAEEFYGRYLEAIDVGDRAERRLGIGDLKHAAEGSRLLTWTLTQKADTFCQLNGIVARALRRDPSDLTRCPRALPKAVSLRSARLRPFGPPLSRNNAVGTARTMRDSSAATCGESGISAHFRARLH